MGEMEMAVTLETQVQETELVVILAMQEIQETLVIQIRVLAATKSLRNTFINSYRNTIGYMWMSRKATGMTNW